MTGPKLVCAACGAVEVGIFSPLCPACTQEAGQALADHITAALDTESIVDRAFTAHGDDLGLAVSQIMDEVLGGIQDLDLSDEEDPSL